MVSSVAPACAPFQIRLSARDNLYGFWYRLQGHPAKPAGMDDPHIQASQETLELMG